MATTTPTPDPLKTLTTFLHTHPEIPYLTPSDPAYPTARATFTLDNNAQSITPLAIARPPTPAAVALLVRHATAHNIPLTIRVGGCDPYGRCFAPGALALDLRDLNHIIVHDDGSNTATLGGGTLQSAIASALAAKGRAAALGTVGWVGYVGWATCGGYGPFTAGLGMGVDQIVGAKVVDARGRVVTVRVEDGNQDREGEGRGEGEGEEDLLWALRGGAGAVGVVVEVTIRTYPLREVLSGTVVFKGEAMAAFRRFAVGWRALLLREGGVPDALGVRQMVVNSPAGSRVFLLSMAWSRDDDLDAGRKWMEEVSALGGEVLRNVVTVSSLPEWLEASGASAPRNAYGLSCGINVRELTDEVLDVFGREMSRMPADPGTFISLQQLRGVSASPREDSVFAARAPHYMVQLSGSSQKPAAARESSLWASGFYDALAATDKENVMSEAFIAQTPPDRAVFSAIYGDKWANFVEVKRRYDPENVFRNAVPKFVEAGLE